MKRRNRTSVLLGIILLVALSLRVWGIGFGLPYLYHPDEPNKIAIAQDMFKTGDLNPHYFDKPTLFIYLNALAYVPYYLLGRLLGVFATPADIPAPAMLTIGVGRTTMPGTVILGRMLTVLFATASVVLVFLIGRQVSDRGSVGLLAALMMAVSPTNVSNSRYITANSFLAFFILVVVWASVRVVQRGKTRDYVLAAVAAGFAVSSKYPGAIVLVVPLLAHFLQPEGKNLRDYRLYLMFVLVLVGFLVTSPFALLDYTEFLDDLLAQARHYSTGHAGMEGNSLMWYLKYMWQTAGILHLLALLGILHGVYSRDKRIILLSVFPLVYFVFISGFSVRNDRTLLPMTPFSFLLAACFLMLSLSRAGRLESGVLRRVSSLAILCLLALGLALPTYQTIAETIRITAVDSRETARVWVDKNLPAGARIAVEAYSPFVDPTRFSVQGHARMIYHPPEWYVDKGFEYLIFSEGMYGRFYREPQRYHGEVTQYDSFFSRFPLVKTFDDGGLEVRIHRVE